MNPANFANTGSSAPQYMNRPSDSMSSKFFDVIIWEGYSVDIWVTLQVVQQIHLQVQIRSRWAHGAIAQQTISQTQT